MNREFQILSRYLPYGVDVQTSATQKYPLDALWLSADLAGVTYQNSKVEWVDADLAKPILYGFSDLTRTHKDAEGKEFVPAFEIARLSLGGRYQYEWDIDREWEAELVVKAKDSGCQVTIYSDWQVVVELYEDFQAVELQFEIVQFFLRNHFAVGLEESEYIRKEVTA